MWVTARRLEKYCNKVRVQINHITYKTKESCKHLIYSSLILIYCIFSDLYFTSSKITRTDYQGLPKCCAKSTPIIIKPFQTINSQRKVSSDFFVLVMCFLLFRGVVAIWCSCLWFLMSSTLRRVLIEPYGGI